MDLVEPILSVASEIYHLVENVKANKKRCGRVAERVHALQQLLDSAGRQRAAPSEQVERALGELRITLEAARELIRKYTEASWMERVLKNAGHGDDFHLVNERLNDAFQVLAGSLQLEQRQALDHIFMDNNRRSQDQRDGEQDDAQLKKDLLEHMKNQEEQMEAMKKNFQQLQTSVEKIVKTISGPQPSDEVIRMISAKELRYGVPKRPFMTTSTSEVYRGEYRGFTVAIKRYLDPPCTSPGKVHDIFHKEVETMRRFESPNILRMFGICVREDKVPPQFLIVMEFCEKGSLRQVLDSGRDLSWTRRTRMSLDAAQGLYRLHQTEQKSKVHGCISSSKFLVAEGYRVKLGGFELSKTDTSLRRGGVKKSSGSLCYSSPQMLGDINHTYSKECEVYSFGIVLWEIATRQKPFEGFSPEDIQQKVCNERFCEPLPEECPESLRLLVDSCRAYQAFGRPSAGVLVDELRRLVETQERQ